MKLLEELKLLLGRDERLVSEGKLFKNRIVEFALKLDKDLIKLLLSNKRVKEYFFTEVDKILVFDKEKFMKFVDNKEFLPDSYTAFKQNIGLIDQYGRYFKSIPWNEVVLAWPYKDCILEGGQEKSDEKRKELFHNEILAPDEIDRLLDPKVFTNFKRIDVRGEHKVKEIKPTDNLIMKGNNLLVLHSLKKRYIGKVKLIYIDPPYNTGNDEFKYNDNFNHSTWLTFMKNRLEVAKDLLREDGVIFVQIDSREHEYLKVLMNEVFNRNNFLSMITLKAKAGGGVGQESYIFDICEYILTYAKDRFKVENYLPFVEEELGSNVKNVYTKIMQNFGSEKHIKNINGGNVGKIIVFEHKEYSTKSLDKNDRTCENYYKFFNKIFRTTNPQGGLMKRVMPQLPKKGLVSIEYVPTKGKSAGQKYRYYFLDGALIVWLKDSAIKNDEEKTVAKLVKNNNLWVENLHQGIAKEGGVELRAGKKPERLIEKILRIATKKGDLVFDYHLGSGTTCAVAHKMGRRYIGVEQLDYGENSAAVRLKNVIDGDTTGISKSVNWQGGGDFIYSELKELNEDFIQKIQDAKDTKELLKIWEDMKEHAFLSYKIEPKDIDKNIEKFKDLSFENQKRFLIEVLDKNDLYINYSEIEDKEYGVSNADIELNKIFYRGL